MKRKSKSNAEFSLSHKRATQENLEKAASLLSPDELFANLSDSDEDIEEPKSPFENEEGVVDVEFSDITVPQIKACPDELKEIFATTGRIFVIIPSCVQITSYAEDTLLVFKNKLLQKWCAVMQCQLPESIGLLLYKMASSCSHEEYTDLAAETVTSLIDNKVSIFTD
jgi:hypothetical protein